MPNLGIDLARVDEELVDIELLVRGESFCFYLVALNI